MIKKEYMKPTIRMVELKHKCHILAASPDPYGMNKNLQNEEVEVAW